MDPRVFHIQLDRYLRNAVWDSASGDEYFLVGKGDVFDRNATQAAIDTTFPGIDFVYASPSRHELRIIERSSAAYVVERYLAIDQQITICDECMDSYLQFRDILVARIGWRAS